MLWVPDVTAAVKLYEDPFSVERRWVRDEGDYAQMETGALMLQFADAKAAPANGIHLQVRRPDLAASGFQLAFSVDDVPAATQRAVDAGGT